MSAFSSRVPVNMLPYRFTDSLIIGSAIFKLGSSYPRQPSDQLPRYLVSIPTFPILCMFTPNFPFCGCTLSMCLSPLKSRYTVMSFICWKYGYCSQPTYESTNCHVPAYCPG